jgi:hypothetical protein
MSLLTIYMADHANRSRLSYAIEAGHYTGFDVKWVGSFSTGSVCSACDRYDRDRAQRLLARESVVGEPVGKTGIA